MTPDDTFCTLTMTRKVATPRLRLFDFLIDFRNEMRFGTAVRQCRIESAAVPGPRNRIGEGTTFAFDYSFFGVGMSTVFVIEDVVDGERFTLRQLRGGIPFRLQYVFVDDGPGCEVTTHSHLLNQGWARLCRKPLALGVDSIMNGYMDQLVTHFVREAS